MKPLQFADFKLNENFESREEFIEAFYKGMQEKREVLPENKGKVVLIATDEMGIPYFWEVSKLINKYTGGKLNSKKLKTDVMLDKIGEALKRRELMLNENGEIEEFAIQIKKAISETGYRG